MRKWILTWILPTLLYSSCFHIICLVGTISLACNDMTPEQMAANVNCSSPERHTRSYDYMEGGDIRVRRLFCRTQWYLRIDKRGKVKGTQEMKNNYSKLCLLFIALLMNHNNLGKASDMLYVSFYFLEKIKPHLLISLNLDSWTVFLKTSWNRASLLR